MEITNVNRKNRHTCSSTKRIIIARHSLCRWKAYDEMSGVASCSFPMHNEKRIKIGPRRMQSPQDSWCADQRQAPKTYMPSTHTWQAILPSPHLYESSIFKSSSHEITFLKYHHTKKKYIPKNVHGSGWVIDNIQKNKNKRNDKLGKSIHSLPPQEIIFPFSLKIKTVSRKKYTNRQKIQTKSKQKRKAKALKHSQRSEPFSGEM